mmetsp:Transcript_4478/g.9001  ORF Transcript_4478/g.9001 Transcript_4478/m.9001 type:complete len:564 (-) Transcript_4478:413-2104(-)
MRIHVNNLAGPVLQHCINDEMLVSSVLAGVKAKDARYLHTVNHLRQLDPPTTLLDVKTALKRTWQDIETDTAREAARGGDSASHVKEVNTSQPCSYPDCTSYHPISQCPLKAADLRLRREAQQMRKNGKGKGGSGKGRGKKVCGYAPCGKTGHDTETCFMCQRDEEEKKMKAKKKKEKGEKEQKKKKKKERANALTEHSSGSEQQETEMLCMAVYSDNTSSEDEAPPPLCADTSSDDDKDVPDLQTNESSDEDEDSSSFTSSCLELSTCSSTVTDSSNDLDSDDDTEILSQCCKLVSEELTCQEDLDYSLMVDSGTTCHLTPNHCHLINIRKCSKKLGDVGKGQCLKVTEVGDMPVNLKRVSKDGAVSYPTVILQEAYHVPRASKPLVSVKKAKLHGFTAHFTLDCWNEGFKDRAGSLYPFFTARNGLSYLSVKHDVSVKKEETEQCMLSDMNAARGAHGAELEPFTAASESGDNDDPPELVASDSSDENDDTESESGSDSESDSGYSSDSEEEPANDDSPPSLEDVLRMEMAIGEPLRGDHNPQRTWSSLQEEKYQQIAMKT